jgi:methionyl-tRNA formyltransferase
MSENVLVVAVHPDDETLGCGGTLLRHKADGDKTFWLVVTSMKKSQGYSNKQMSYLLSQMNKGELSLLPKSPAIGNIWRRRNSSDGQIDFRMNSRTIYNLTRALTKPYVGAHLEVNGKNIKVWQVEETILDLPNVEPGRVIDIKGKNISVKTADSGITLKKHEFEKLPNVGFCL